MNKDWLGNGFRMLEFLMAAALAIMAVLVFSNVVLRYGFNSGIAESEDLSRFLFVWVCFVGAVVAMKEHSHLGMDTLVKMLPHKGKLVAHTISHVLMLAVLSLLLWGSWQQMLLNAGSLALGAVPYPLSWIYAAGVFCSAACLVIVFANLVRALSGRMTDEELVLVQDPEAVIEEELASHAQEAQLAERASHGENTK